MPNRRLLHPNEYVIIDVKEMPPVDYQVQVQTSDRFNAGTSAKVHLTIFGNNGSSGRCVRLVALCWYGQVCLHPARGQQYVAGLNTAEWEFGDLPSFKICRSIASCLTLLMKCARCRVPLEAEGVDAGGKGTLPKMCVDRCSTGGPSFSRNALDTFTLKGLPDVGRLQEIEIGHDNTGMGPGGWQACYAWRQESWSTANGKAGGKLDDSTT